MAASVAAAEQTTGSGRVAGAGRGRPSAERSAEITTGIVRCAAEIFLAEGYEATSMEAVARAVGVPKSTLYKRFPDKAALLRAVVDDFMQQWSARRGERSSAGAQSLAENLAEQLAAVLVGATNPEVRSVNRLAMNLPESLGHELSGRTFWGYRAMHERVAATIRRLGAERGVRAADPERLAETLLDLTAGWLVTHGTVRQVRRDEALATARWFVDLAIRGVSAW